MLEPSRIMNTTYEGTDIIGYYCMCICTLKLLYNYMVAPMLATYLGVSVAKPIKYNIVLLLCTMHIYLP